MGTTGFWLSTAAMFFAIIAGYFLYSGLTLETTVPTMDGEVANLQMMHIQSLNFAVGIGSAVISAIFVGSAAVAAVVRAD